MCGGLVFPAPPKWQMHLIAMNPYFVVADVFWPLLKAEIVPPTAVLLTGMASSAL